MRDFGEVALPAAVARRHFGRTNPDGKSEMNSMEVPQGMMRPGVTQFWQNEARSESAIESRPSMTKHMNPPPGRLDTRVSNLGAT
jgi:hypothetical protein